MLSSVEARNYAFAMGEPAEPLLDDGHDAGAEAWSLIMELALSEKATVLAAAAAFDLTAMQAHALRLLAPGRTLPMNRLADALGCDASNVTGIVDRLEARGLIERRSAPHDRRVKLLAVTTAGAALRAALCGRMYRAPAGIAALPAADQRALRDLLRRAAREGDRPRGGVHFLP
jgi:DNA-binding MarR family transcriptional regulator